MAQLVMTVLAIALAAFLGPNLTNAMIAIGIFNIPVFARVARAGALSIWPREYILAARAAGKGPTLITVEHILPNIASILLVQGTIQFALGILAETGLSYLGLGAQPPMPSWGRMLFDAQTRMTLQEELTRIWEERRPTIVFITHDVSEAVFLANKVVVLSKGNVLEQVDIPLDRPRSWDRLVEDDQFKAMSNQVLQLVRSA